jgi:acyl-CoA dehydrogenase
VPLSQRIGEGGRGLQDRDAHAGRLPHLGRGGGLGFARRALDEALQRATTRRMFGQTLADFQLTQAKLARWPPPSTAPRC